jgi:hypothetical protein
MEGVLETAALNDFNPAEALKFARLNMRTSQALLQLDPNATVSKNNMSVALSNVGDALWQVGQVRGVSK